jgi:hypothetical protein
MNSSEQETVTPSALEDATSASSTSDMCHPSRVQLSRLENTSDSIAFFLAPSLVEAMQRMPGTFPGSTATSGNTQESISLRGNNIRSDQDSDQSTQRDEVLESSPDNTLASAKPRHVRSKKIRHCKRHEFNLETSEDEELNRFIESEDGRLMMLKKELREKRCEMEEAHNYNNQLSQVLDEQLAEAQKELDGAQKELAGARKELDEVHEKLKKKTIYAKSLDEYVDELEIKVELLTQSHASPSTKKSQNGIKMDSTTTLAPAQPTSSQDGFIPVGDAVYRWQDYMIKSLQRQRDNLVGVSKDLTERYNKAFRDAILFNRKLNDNKKAMEGHVRLCHGPNSFLPQDMAELKTDLDKIYAICIDNGEDRAEYREADREEKQGYEEEIKDESQGSASGSDCTTGSVTEDSDAEGE